MKSTVILSALLTLACVYSVSASSPAPLVSAGAVLQEKTAPAKTKKTARKRSLQQDIKIATTPRQTPKYAQRLAAKKAYAAANKDKIKILMLGDSITHQWERATAAEALAKYITPYNVLNLGCGGDRTQHTLWVVEKSGILELIKPQLVTLMIGTNNATRNDYRATIAGIKRILERVREKYPQTPILLYAIFPRGKDINDKHRMENEKVNAEIVKFCDGKNIIWIDINQKFLTKDGDLTTEVMPDLLHPRKSKSYAIWGESLKPYFEKYGK